MTTDVAFALIALGTAVIVASAIGAVVVRTGELDRLHFLTPATSFGAPLIGIGLCARNGWGLATGEILLVVVLLFLTGPVISSATGHLIAQQRGIIERNPPE
jgi:multicomponent Na+:H+ antiporter subunit G